MSIKGITYVAAVAFLVVQPLEVLAATTTITFESAPSCQVFDRPNTQGFVDSGFYFTPVGVDYCFGTYSRGMHHDIYGEGDWSRGFSMVRSHGGAFDVLSFLFSASTPASAFVGDPESDVFVTGFRAGTAVGNAALSIQGGSQAVSLGLDFLNIDRFEILGIPASNFDRYSLQDYDYHFNIRDIVVASPVPLPAGGFLLLSGIAGFAAVKRRKKLAFVKQ